MTGHQVIEAALAKAAKCDPQNSPAVYDPPEGKAYQEGLRDAYLHALEMIPAEAPLDAWGVNIRLGSQMYVAHSNQFSNGTLIVTIKRKPR